MSAADRQRQLLDVALAVFSRKGFKGATMKAIAAEAGVAEAVIFQHFPSKEALYNAVLELNLGAWGTGKDADDIRGYMERGDDEGLLRTSILHILNCYRTNPAFQRVVLFAALEGHEQGINRLMEQFTPAYKQFHEYIEKRQREGALKACDPFALLMHFVGGAHHYGMVTGIMRAAVRDIPDEDVVEQFTKILLDGIRKRRPEKNTQNGNAPRRVKKIQKGK